MSKLESKVALVTGASGDSGWLTGEIILAVRRTAITAESNTSRRHSCLHSWCSYAKRHSISRS